MSPLSLSRNALTRAAAVALVAVAVTLLLVAQLGHGHPSCQVPNCHRCLPDNEFACEVCESGDYILYRGQCSPRGTCGITACLRCEEGSVARCEVCEKGYVRTAKGLCASLVVCDMDKCASQEEMQSRVAQTTVECSAEEAVKGDGDYVCVASRSGGRGYTVGAASAGLPGWVYAAVGTAVAAVVGFWMMPSQRRKASA